MADVKITELPVAYSSGSADYFVLVQSSVTKKITNGNLFTNATLTSPTFVTPVLGTPTSGTLTNCSGLPLTGLATLNANLIPFLQTPSSANLASAVTNETGSGALVFANAPTLIGPNIGTPSAGVLTSCTGLPLTTGVTGILPAANGGTGLSALGTGVATFLATPSSANLAAALTDETGSGSVVFSASPTLTGTVTAANIKFSGLIASSAAAPTIASATTIAPTTPIVFVSGTTAIATITPPSPISLGGGQITIIPTDAFTTTTAGNIALASTAVVSKALIMTYDATTTKWYPSY